MIKIVEDKSYLTKKDSLFLEKDLAKLSIHSIRIDRHWTKEEMEENCNEAKNLSKESWSKRCDESKSCTASKIEQIMDILSEHFKIYQYKDHSVSYNDDYDLFFWCNCGDLSHISLNPNKKRDLNSQLNTINEAINLINKIESDITDKLELRIKYQADYNKCLIANIANQYFNTIEDKFIEFNGYIGRVKKEIDVNEHICYRFFKKGARKRYYDVSNEDLCYLSLLNI